MKKLIIAVDFSDSCNNAIEYIKDLTGGTEIIVDLVHVYSLPVSTIISLSPDDVISRISERKEQLEESLIEYMSSINHKNRGNIHAVYGNYPSSDIIDVASNCNADLIIMALRQKYSMFDRFIGTVTANTMSRATIPVLAIPNGSKFKNSPKILFPTELPYSEALTMELTSGMDKLYQFCSLLTDPSIFMVHINQGEGINVSYRDASNIEFIVSNAKSVEQGIRKILNKKSIGLIAIEKKNRKFWERLYHSSLTRKLLYHARLPILIFTE